MLNMRTITYRPVDFRINSRHVRKDVQAIWNSHIDDYIRQGTDSRAAEDIERAAKISGRNGAYFKTCGAPDCNEVESRSAKFRCCARCKIVSSRGVNRYAAADGRDRRPRIAAKLVRGRRGSRTRKTAARRSRLRRVCHHRHQSRA